MNKPTPINIADALVFILLGALFAIAVTLLLSVIPARAWDARFRIEEPPPPIPTAYSAQVVVDGVPMTLAVPLVPLPVQPETGVITADGRNLPAGRLLIFRVQATDGGANGALSNAIEVSCDGDLIPCAATTTTTTSSTTTSTTTTTQPPASRCDINGDGMIGASDALAILQAAVGVRPNLCE